jgi:hypothetical protein
MENRHVLKRVTISIAFFVGLMFAVQNWIFALQGQSACLYCWELPVIFLLKAWDNPPELSHPLPTFFVNATLYAIPYAMFWWVAIEGKLKKREGMDTAQILRRVFPSSVLIGLIVFLAELRMAQGGELGLFIMIWLMMPIGFLVALVTKPFGITANLLYGKTGWFALVANPVIYAILWSFICWQILKRRKGPHEK